MSCGITHRFAAVRLLVLAALWLCWSGSSLAQTYKTIYLFGGGGGPRGTLVEGTDGNLYGTTYGKGGRNNGMIFKITPGGTFTTLHAGGGTFQTGLTLGTDGNFYGTSVAGGTSGGGYVFKITPSGTLTTLYSFGPGPRRPLTGTACPGQRWELLWDDPARWNERWRDALQNHPKRHADHDL